jgi:hypothetical protein
MEISIVEKKLSVLFFIHRRDAKAQRKNSLRPLKSPGILNVSV